MGLLFITVCGRVMSECVQCLVICIYLLNKSYWALYWYSPYEEPSGKIWEGEEHRKLNSNRSNVTPCAQRVAGTGRICGEVWFFILTLKNYSLLHLGWHLSKLEASMYLSSLLHPTTELHWHPLQPLLQGWAGRNSTHFNSSSRIMQNAFLGGSNCPSYLHLQNPIKI